jgi:hypothetical protein
MENLETIEQYFNNTLSTEDKIAFGEKIESDLAFAEEVAFYLSARESLAAAAEESKKERFREIYNNNKPARSFSAIKLVYYIAAAAAITGIIFGLYVFNRPVSPNQLADKYIRENLQTLAVRMGGHDDSLQTGLRLYNEGKTSESLQQFENIIRSDTANFTAKKFAGIAALKMNDYNKALSYFKQLETYTTLFANPALFYQSLTLMKRNQPGDAEKAKQLMHKIQVEDLEGKDAATRWLRKL